MYCTNCGNKVDENAFVCVRCGVILKNKNNNVSSKRKVKKDENITGILSIIFASLSLFICLSCLAFADISDVGMYTEIIDRFFYAIGFNIVQIAFAVVSLILSLINSKFKLNKIGLIITLSAIFLIITEFVVILIY